MEAMQVEFAWSTGCVVDIVLLIPIIRLLL